MKQQDSLMKFDPASGAPKPYPSHAQQWRDWHGEVAWLFDPWDGKKRDARDVGSDVFGVLIVPAGEPVFSCKQDAKQNDSEIENADKQPHPADRASLGGTSAGVFRDTARLAFLMSEIEAFFGVQKDRYDFARDVAAAAGREEPTDADELEGFRRLIDAAMSGPR